MFLFNMFAIKKSVFLADYTFQSSSGIIIYFRSPTIAATCLDILDPSLTSTTRTTYHGLMVAILVEPNVIEGFGSLMPAFVVCTSESSSFQNVKTLYHTISHPTTTGLNHMCSTLSDLPNRPP